MGGPSGQVDEDIDGAGLCDQPVRECGIGQVSGNCPQGLARLRLQVCKPAFAAGDGNHPRAFGGKGHSAGPADTLSGGGDEGKLTGKTIGHGNGLLRTAHDAPTFL